MLLPPSLFLGVYLRSVPPEVAVVSFRTVALKEEVIVELVVEEEYDDDDNNDKQREEMRIFFGLSNGRYKIARMQDWIETYPHFV